MQEMDQKQKNKYVKSIVLNVVIIFAILGVVYAFIVPMYENMNTLIGTINVTHTAVSDLQQNGVNSDQFSALATQYNRKKELGNDIFSDSEKLEKVLKKPASFQGDYLAWASTEAGKIDVINNEIEKNDRILGNIIPNYTNTVSVPTEDNAFIKNQVTLQSFVSYIEKDILAKYSLSSFAPIGINDVNFDAIKNPVANIGSFKITLDFLGKNSDISAFIESIQRSGKLVIRDGKLVPDDADKNVAESSLSSLSNLLININSLTLNTVLENNNKPNTGTIVLEFYIEGMNYQKLLILRNSITSRFEALRKGVRDNGGLCIKGDNVLCQDGTTSAAVSAIKNLGRSMIELQSSIDALKKGQSVVDMSHELDALATLQSTIRNMENIYNRNTAILTKAKTKSIHK